MALLTPLFLLGLLGIALPLWLHRLQTQTRERQAFSSAMFLEPSQQRIHVQRQLKYLLLLALRLLFLIILVVAFTRPIWQVPAEGTLGSDGRHHVIVIDASLSMQEGERFSQALSLAREQLDNMSSNDLGSLYLASSRLTPVLERSEDPAALRQALSDLAPDAGRLDLAQMMTALGSLLPRRDEPMALYVISDFQQSAQPARFADLVPRTFSGRNLALHPVPVVSGRTPNWAISGIRTSTEQITVQVQGYNTEATERTVRLFVNDSLQGEQEQRVPANGLATFVFDTPALQSGDNQVRAALAENDSLPADDSRLSVLDNSPPAPVLVLTHNPESLAVTYLRAALASAPRPYAAEVTAINALDPRILPRYSWVIIEDLGAVNSSLAEALDNYLQGGGALLAAVGERSLGLAQLPLTGQRLRNEIRNPGVDPMVITRIDGSHPALRDSSGWANVTISRTLPLQPEPDDRVLIGLAQQTPLLLEQQRGLGRVLLINSALDNTWTDLPVRPVFVGFLAEVARVLSGEDLLQREQTLFSTLQLQASGTGAGQVYDPQGNRLLRLQDTAQGQQITLNQNGFYQVFTPEGEKFIAVNPDIRESDLSMMASDSLQNWQRAVAATATGSARLSSDSEAADLTQQRELWHLLLVLLVVLVIAESLLANRHLAFHTDAPTGRPT